MGGRGGEAKGAHSVFQGATSDRTFLGQKAWVNNGQAGCAGRAPISKIHAGEEKRNWNFQQTSDVFNFSTCSVKFHWLKKGFFFSSSSSKGWTLKAF